MRRVIVRRTSIAIMCACVAYLCIRVVLGHHYSVAVQNSGNESIAVDVLFIPGAVQRLNLGPGETACMASWVRQDGKLVIRAGGGQDESYVSGALGAAVRVDVTATSVRVVDERRTFVPWRQCWLPP